MLSTPMFCFSAHSFSPSLFLLSLFLYYYLQIIPCDKIKHVLYMKIK